MSEDRRPKNWFNEESSGALDAQIREAAHQEIDRNLGVSDRRGLLGLVRRPWLAPALLGTIVTIYLARRSANTHPDQSQNEPLLHVAGFTPSEWIETGIDDPLSLAEFVETLTGAISSKEEKWQGVAQSFSANLNLNSRSEATSELEDEQLLVAFADADQEIDRLISAAQEET